VPGDSIASADDVFSTSGGEVSPTVSLHCRGSKVTVLALRAATVGALVTWVVVSASPTASDAASSPASSVGVRVDVDASDEVSSAGDVVDIAATALMSSASAIFSRSRLQVNQRFGY